MYLTDINQKLALGEIDSPGLFPKLEQLETAPFVFRIDFGLSKLPEEAGILSIRGSRQYGKSTWLESMLKKTIIEFGRGSAFYLNGDFILTVDRLMQEIENLLPCFEKNAAVRRIFIDEITAVSNFEIALKRLADRGLLHDVLLVTTGSSATDLLRGVERLPGRKGKLSRTHYFFTPISYSEFYRVCHKILKEKTLPAYIISGGSPVACAALAKQGVLPDYVIELTRDWILGEINKASRSLLSLQNIFNVIFQFSGTPVGQAKLAREAGLSNNTVANNYITLLHNLGVITPFYSWDQHKKRMILRKPCKYHFTNLLAATAYFPKQIRRIEDFESLPEKTQGQWLEWMVAQELFRRSAIAGALFFEQAAFWQNDSHEIDFVYVPTDSFIEVKRGSANPLEFSWFSKQFPKKILTVINKKSFQQSCVVGVTLEDFLLQV